LFLWASLPLDREVPSFRIRTGISDVAGHALIVSAIYSVEINICDLEPRGGDDIARIIIPPR